METTWYTSTKCRSCGCEDDRGSNTACKNHGSLGRSKSGADHRKSLPNWWSSQNSSAKSLACTSFRMRSWIWFLGLHAKEKVDDGRSNGSQFLRTSIPNSNTPYVIYAIEKAVWYPGERAVLFRKEELYRRTEHGPIKNCPRDSCCQSYKSRIQGHPLLFLFIGRELLYYGHRVPGWLLCPRRFSELD